MDAVRRNQGQYPIAVGLLAPRNGERTPQRLVTLVGRHAGTRIDKRTKVAADRCEAVIQDQVIFACAVHLEEAQVGPGPVNAVGGFCVAGRFVRVPGIRMAGFTSVEILVLFTVKENCWVSTSAFPTACPAQTPFPRHEEDAASGACRPSGRPGNGPRTIPGANRCRPLRHRRRQRPTSCAASKSDIQTSPVISLYWCFRKAEC